ncbi:Pr6Pr family membrane protein [Parapedobacter pyrenivorans]|uniref:Pr6Pr family membrane protein n=1 Tax=Parapedobacter pyrenivorans TaxID=1305674 RepID=UPI00333F1B85
MKSHRKSLAFIFAAVGWFAVIAQFLLMLNNSVLPLGENIVRFFSFFTILTNLLVALFFTLQALGIRKFDGGALTAITVYITIVGLVYQVLLRQLWTPTGLQKVVDELLHSVMPVVTIGYWYCYGHRHGVFYNQVPKWLVFPFFYLGYILVRGYFSGFYPYPFMDVAMLGLPKVIGNAAGMVVLFMLVSLFFVYVGRKLKELG